jgi:Zn-dependent protease
MLLIVTNLVLFAFNLIPAFPMDGGRILRGFMALFLPYPHATRLAMAIGFTIAVLLIVLAFTQGNAGLFFVAIFILIAAKPLRAK